MKLSAVLIVRNEQENIEECLRTVNFADEIVVVDGGSSDNTVELARKYTNAVYVRIFDDFSSQRNYAADKASGDWLFVIDADERVSPALADEIRSAAQGTGKVYAVTRHNFFWGKWLRFSGSQSDAPVRLYPKGAGVWQQPVHEYLETSLPVEKLKEFLVHHTTRDLDHYMEKVRRYVPLEAETMRKKGRSVFFWDVILRPVLKFFYLYIIRWGILDGMVGLQFAALSSYYDFKKYSLFFSFRSGKGML